MGASHGYRTLNCINTVFNQSQFWHLTEVQQIYFLCVLRKNGD